MSVPDDTIWRMQANADVRGLVEKLQHADATVRRRAVMALRLLNATGAIPALQTLLAREPDPTVRQAILVTLDDLFEQALDDELGSGST